MTAAATPAVTVSTMGWPMPSQQLSRTLFSPYMAMPAVSTMSGTAAASYLPPKTLAVSGRASTTRAVARGRVTAAVKTSTRTRKRPTSRSDSRATRGVSTKATAEGMSMKPLAIALAAP